MPISNLNNTHLSPEQINVVNKALDTIDSALANIIVNLNDKDRKKYGSINEQNKLFVNKVKDFQVSSPQLASDDVDWKEFSQDYADRLALETFLNRLQSLVLGLDNSKILHDYDNLQAALNDYDFTTFKAGGSKPGFERKYKELKQFFVKKPKTGNEGGTEEPGSPQE